ncbi:MAG: saccharopine dehydrogenase NADP-binding domain-containing protein [Anaerolineales bacterium]|nr:saccharopine dehydrogenase NADP-binding domain-containing protein [Anaerolineales bacterium]
MKILLLGVGMQGKAALHDLAQSENVAEIIAADWDIDGLQAYVDDRQYAAKIKCEHVDAANVESIDRLMASRPDVVIDLLPGVFHNAAAAAAVRHGSHFVNTSYTTPEMKALADEARAKEVTILPEFGMDPGIDLVLLGEAVRGFERVDEIISYGAGFPELEAADNPLKYKVTWTFEGVLISYRRAGRVIRDGKVVEIQDTEMFSPDHIHEIEIEGLGKLEAFPNGDALKYADLLGIDPAGLRNMGRYVLRWPGHCAFWKTLVDLGFLDDGPLMVGGMALNRKEFLTALIESQIQYGADERDIVVVRIDVAGIKDGKKQRVIYQSIDRRDLETGFTSMSRTVGYTASIGAQMIGTGQITKRGLLSPVNDIPYDIFAQELAKRDIQITSVT